ncbi:MAG: hypothetical protein AB8B95_11720 [Pseudohongiellaceae bacterium]
MLRAFLLLTAFPLLTTLAFAQPLELPPHAPIPIQTLTAVPLKSYPAVEAGQGAAADETHFYAVVNSAIGKYDKEAGQLAARWMGSREGSVRHLNSCFAEDEKLYCSNSNFPELPMASSIEIFNTESMTSLFTLSLGVMEEGSLTWFDHLNGGWIAGFAHYDGRGGLAFKDHSFASIVRYDSQWRRLGGWMLPPSVIEPMKPYAASGGAIGPDGLLYLTGHDRTEMYVLGLPSAGPKLMHIATIEIDIEGQAFAFDKTSGDRVVYGISRPNKEVRAFEIPVVALPDGVIPLSSGNFELP